MVCTIRKGEIWVICLLIMLFISVGAPVVYAQGTTASISGKVADESGAVVPGVTVTVTNADTQVSRALVTDDAGAYRATELEVGNYEIKAELVGFQTSIRKGIQLTIGRNAAVDIVLKVGEVSEQVTVTGEASLVETREATLAGVVTTQAIEDLPLNGRNFVQLTMLEAGVANALAATTNNGVTHKGFGIDITVAGARPVANSFLLDGAYINDHRNKLPGSVAGVTLGVDSVREFKVMSANFSAEYGQAGGAVVTAVTKSGTNEFHGSLFEFHRNSALDARNFFAKAKDPFKRNQFGGSIGGPIARDQTFFFANYEGLRDRLGRTNLITVPTADARRGVIPGRAPIQVVPSVKPYLDYFWPLPNGRDFGDGRAEYLYSFSEPTDEDYVVGKVDHNFSQDHSFSTRYTFDNATARKSFDTHAFNKFFTRNQYVTLEEKAIITAQLLNIARFSFIRSRQGDDNDVIVPIDPSLYFIPEAGQIGSLSVTGLSTTTADDRPREFDQNLFQFSDGVTYNKGRQSWKIGADIKRYQYNGLSVSRFGGRINFSSLTDLLLGTPRNIEAQLPTADFRRGLRNWVVGLYVQDDFQMRSNFTFNLGVRYEFITVPTEVNGKISNLRSNSDSKLTFGEPYFPNPSLRNVAPRIGFSWDPSGSGKTAIRAAYGIFYDQINMFWFQQPVFRMPPAAQVSLLSPPFPKPFAGGTPAGTTTDPHNFPWDAMKGTGYLMKWNLNVQREIIPGTVATIGYVGSRGVKLGLFMEANLALPQYLPDGRRFFPAGLTRRNPNFGSINTRSSEGNSFYHGMILTVKRRFAEGFAVQVSYTMSKSIDDMSSHTQGSEFSSTSWQGMIDDPQGMRGLSEFDVRHNLVINGSWALPAPDVSGWMGRLVKGWELNGIATMSSGFPLTPTITGTWILDQNPAPAGYVPDLIPGGKNNPVLGGPDRYFDPSQFSLPSRNLYGNLGRSTLTSPGLATIDFSLAKKWPLPGLGEGKQLEFRSEFFNMFNRANFGVPALNVFDGRGTAVGTAGRINTTTTTARQIQFGLKITF
ncbi:MAG: TonB-dependent receptor [Acidobacteria bacterium]|nr:TonB-dependent receptor [Acidobacteriota bacterium]